MTLERSLMGMPRSKPGNLSERSKNIKKKRGSHGLQISAISPLNNDFISLEFQKKVLKQQLLDYENSVLKSKND